MRLFVSSLSAQSGGVNPFPIPEIAPWTQPITIGVDTGNTTAWWWYPYLASDFPEITGVTKKYFWLYSTDHEGGGSFWGQGDDLGLSDFQEMGYLNQWGNSQETPRLYRVTENVDGEQLYLFYHPVVIPQQTRLYTSAGGSLTNIGGSSDWTFKDAVLGLHTLANGNQIGGVDEGHTGYFTMRKLPYGTYQARHLAVGGDLDNFLYRYSTSPDGIVWTRTGDEPRIEIIDGEEWYPYNKMESVYTFGDRNYQISFYQSKTEQTSISLALVDDDWKNVSFVKFLGETGEPNASNTSYLDTETNILHIYAHNQGSTKLYHSTLDMNNADKWILP